MKNIVIVNYKTYKSAVGYNAVKLTKKLIEKAKDVDLMIATSNVDIAKVSELNVKVLAQHIDNVDFGKGTGNVTGKAIKDNGAFGVLMNHAEDKMDLKDIKENIKRCKLLKLKTVVCCATIKEAEKILKYKPDYIAYEVTELIGTGKSISKSSPGLIQKFVRIVQDKSIPLCGAGVTDNADFQAAIKLGAKGVLVSSAITKARRPERVMQDLIKPPK